MAIVSMTGFGRGESQGLGIKVSVELSTVNRKQFDCNISMPRDLMGFEAKLHALIHTRIVRGCVKGLVSIAAVGDNEQSALLDLQRIRTQVAALKAAAVQLGLEDDVRASTLLRFPELFKSGLSESDPDAIWALIERAALAALEMLCAMREREGVALEQDLRQRFAELKKISVAIAPRAAEVPKNYQTILSRRLAELMGSGEATVDPALLAREVAVFADRCDVSEELTRLASHFEQVDEVLRDGQASGRRLDFLCQEMFREINTTGSKANDAEITRRVIAFKAGLEAAREQVQNIE